MRRDEKELLDGFKREATKLIDRAGRTFSARDQARLLRKAGIAQRNAVMLAFRLAMSNNKTRGLSS